LYGREIREKVLGQRCHACGEGGRDVSVTDTPPDPCSSVVLKRPKLIPFVGMLDPEGDTSFHGEEGVLDDHFHLR
jgi:hypothetical protein